MKQSNIIRLANLVLFCIFSSIISTVYADIVINEDFNDHYYRYSDTQPLLEVTGVWRSSGGRIGIHDPVRSSKLQSLSNIAVHPSGIGSTFDAFFVIEAEETSSNWDDIAFIFGYQNPQNYLFLSLNERDDDATSGVFSVVDGVLNQLVNIPQRIHGGERNGFRVSRENNVIKIYSNNLDFISPWPDHGFEAPSVTIQTQLFPEGLIGFGSKNNAVFVEQLVVFDNIWDLSDYTNVPQEQFGLIYQDEFPEESYLTIDEFLVPLTGEWDWTSSSSALYHLYNPLPFNGQRPFNANLAVSNPLTTYDYLSLSEDFKMRVRFLVPDASGAWGDISIIFGYHDINNYLFVSFAEKNDKYVSGIFAVINGKAIELADITQSIKSNIEYTARVDRWGDAIWVYLNDKPIAKAFTPALPRGGWGFGSRNNQIMASNPSLHFFNSNPNRQSKKAL